ncbi:GNAT family N-acetyltransferase [Rahnella sp. C60]|uniref:GNAT family N-acetyltransferase n=1 Tax=Rahnella TaxID=34037 RepID=UPI00101E8785|nr:MULTISPECIES: GNAT family N-acetyltransferase [Rahnella]UJD90334.1 GNAT family N-acetyltransferase [Rahnella aquatilis]MBU9811287.1 GNAT family N-acetyltransferase [Rahnella perminowiae]MBU9816779.1 GNAT family N-acetyltransferase [Rahnella perminowiae]MCR9000553.1 GNAT family N-acetyltransferase [Rahnella perminowiae]MCX2944767.1 GNAT family N-acetyltransferase [Rahnella perminowiae]
MPVRRATPDEAEALWNIRNQAIRHGCKNAYDAQIVMAWTPDEMPAGYRKAIIDNPFFVAQTQGLSTPAATGFLDLKNGSVEAIFTLPEFEGKGLATQILAAIKAEAKSRGFTALTLASTPNAFEFYKRNGFSLVKESLYRSEMADADLRCMEMRCEL